MSNTQTITDNWSNVKSPLGRPSKIKTAAELWARAIEYFNWCDNNPIYVVDFRGKDAHRVSVPHARPYTLTGFCTHIGVNEAYFRQYSNKDDRKMKDFSTVLTRVKQIIYTQKFEGAAIGIYNANIIGRDLGLADKKEITGADGASVFTLNIDPPKDK